MTVPKLPDFRYVLFLWIIFVMLAAGIILTGIFNYRNKANHYQREMEHKLSAIADLKAGEILQWKTERLRDAQVFFRSQVFRGLIRDFLGRPGDRIVEKNLRDWMARVQRQYDYDRVHLTDARGAVRLSVPASEEHLPPLIIQKTAAALESGQITFVDFYRSRYSSKIYLNLLVPIPDEREGGPARGVISLRIDPEVYLYPFIRSWPEPSRTAETLLIRRDGNDVLFLNELKYQKNAALTLRLSLKDQAVPAVKAVLGWKGIVEGLDYRKVPVLSAVRAIPDSPWFLVAKMDLSELYEPMRETRWLIILLVGALLTGSGVGVGFVWRQTRLVFYREQYRAAEALRRAHDELEQRVEERTREVRALSAKLLSAQEEERKKIALDLHDGIGGLLSAIKYKIEGGPDFSQRGELVSMLQGASEECRRIQMALRPPLLDDLGLLATLSWLIREFQTRAPSLKIERRFAVEESAIPERLRMVIFRIVQEALNNITKYSGAEEVRLSLDKTNGALRLEVRDNGRGFQIEQALAQGRSGYGFGLAGMQERTALSGGTLTIESAPAKGTIVRALWPENY